MNLPSGLLLDNRADGTLYSLSGYISWDVGDDEVSLDGEFTVQDLEFIINHIKAHTKERV